MGFTVLKGDQTIGINTDSIVFINRSTDDDKFFVNFYMGVDSRAWISFDDKNLRNKAFETLLRDISNGSVKTSYELGFTNYSEPLVRTRDIIIKGFDSDVPVRNEPIVVEAHVTGAGTRAVLISNGHNQDGEQMPLKVTHVSEDY